MSLSSTLSLAQSSLANNAAQSAILSNNIANVNNPDYARRSAASITQLPGSVVTGSTQRATNTALLASLLAATSTAASSQALSDGLTQIASMLGLDSSSSTSDVASNDKSQATLISNLSNALQAYAASPDNAGIATSALTAAKALATNLNQAAASVQNVRQQADKGMATSVATINSLLAQFKTVNDAIVKGTAAGTDVNSALDTRDGLLKQLSGEIGITTVNGSNNSLSIYTDSGVTLFETSPRAVSFTPTSAFTSGTVGGAVTIDGVAVTGASAVMPIRSGSLAGLATLRDTTSVAYQDQLDQIAGGLINAFSESSTSNPTLAGIFTAAGSTAIPTSAAGLAAKIGINAAVDPENGGLATRLRDGINYTYNTTGAAAYSGRLQDMLSALGQTRTYNPASGGAPTGTLAAYAQSSVGWLEATRQSATSDASYKSTLVSTTTTSLSNATGVNIDDEMSKMLDIEHAYQASAQLLNTVKSMYATLLQAFN